MKKVNIIGITSQNKLIITVPLQNHQLHEVKLQGFIISSNPAKRQHLKQKLLKKQIECSTNSGSKGQKMIRYYNVQLLKELIKEGAIQVNQKELQESKIFNQKQKQSLCQIEKETYSKNFQQQTSSYLNSRQQSKILNQFISSKTILKSAQIQSLGENILISFIQLTTSKKYYLHCKLLQFKSYFELFSQINFYKSHNFSKIFEAELNIKIVQRKVNLNDNNNDVFIEIQNNNLLDYLLSEGYITVKQSGFINHSTQLYNNYLNQNQIAKTNHRGIYLSEKNKFQLLNYIHATNNYVGVITNIIQGYIYQISSINRKDGIIIEKTDKIQLEMICCPIGQDSGAFQCRQFARKQLIGQEVNIYLQRQQENSLNITGNIIRVKDYKDIESYMLENGFAFVKQQFRNTLKAQKYVVLENKAKQKKKQLHKSDRQNKRYQNLCQSVILNANNKEKHVGYLQRRYEIMNLFNQQQKGVIQQIYGSILRYKIRIESLNILINFKLQHILQPTISPNLPEYKTIKQVQRKYVNRHLRQRNVLVKITQYDEKTNEFIGTMMVQQQNKNNRNINSIKLTNVQSQLLRQSLVYIDSTDYNVPSEFYEIQENAKSKKKLIWEDKLKGFLERESFEDDKLIFQGRFSWIVDGKDVYLQLNSNYQALQNMQNQIRSTKLNPLKKKHLQCDAWCAAPYNEQIYRAVIKSSPQLNKKKNQYFVKVQFIDWGNEQTIQTTELYELPAKYLYIQKQCFKAKLNLILPTRNIDTLQKVRQMLIYESNGNFVFKKQKTEGIELLNVFENEIQSVNQELIQKGLLKGDFLQIKNHQNYLRLKQIQEQLRKQRYGIWQDSDEDDYQDKQEILLSRYDRK